MGDVLVDAGTRHARRRILRELDDRSVSAHALTHAHFDHQGSSHAICDKLGVPLLCPQGDADAMEGKADVFDLIPRNRITRWQSRHWAGPPHHVAKRLREGDAVAGFRVLETPGHSPGHVICWREPDRVLVAGDVLIGTNLVTSIPGLHEPPEVFTPDPARNRESIRRVAALEPALVLFGHGPPWRDPAKLAAFAERLPA
jgi:hydroxyacylglutathione hydrolase